MTPEIALSLFADGLYLTVVMVLLIVGPSLVVGLGGQYVSGGYTD